MEEFFKLFAVLKHSTLSTRRALFVCLLVLPVSACTQKFKDLGATVDNAVFGEKDIQLSEQELRASPYASLYARVDDGRQIHMVLAFAETDPLTGKQLLKWMSADRAMIVTLEGRIVKTLALPDANLAGLTLDSDRASYDWQPGYRYGYTAAISRERIASELVETPLQDFKTEHYIETVKFAQLDESIENHYWINKKGRVIKTVQYLGPDMHKIELLLIKDFG